MLSMKTGVRLSQEQAMTMLLLVVRDVFGDQPCVVTSGIDGTHSEHSLHYRGLAYDFRTKLLPETQKDRLVAEVRRRLTVDFDVLLENRGGDNEHLHVEWDPKDYHTGEA